MFILATYANKLGYLLRSQLVTHSLLVYHGEHGGKRG